MVGNGFNGEILAGISLTLFGMMLIIFGMVNKVAAILIPGDIVIVCIGIGLIILGVYTNKKNALIHS